jgi:microcompartment protein CcmK/EutM
MILARVTGKVTGSVQHPSYDGRPLYALRRVGADGGLDGSGCFLAVDTVGCAPGDHVLVARVPGMAARILRAERAPVRSLILGILDAPPS